MAEFDIGNVTGYVLVIILVFSLYYVAATLTNPSDKDESSQIDKEAEEIRVDLMEGIEGINEKLDEIGDVVDEP